MNDSQLLAGVPICQDDEDKGKHPAVAVRSSDAGGMDFGRNTVVWRARIVRLPADRVGVMAVVRSIGKSKVTIGRSQERYLAEGIAGLRCDGTGPGHKPPLNAATGLCTKPCTSGLRPQRIWKSREHKPHLVKMFKLSNDKQFVEEVQNRGRRSIARSLACRSRRATASP